MEPDWSHFFTLDWFALKVVHFEQMHLKQSWVILKFEGENARLLKSAGHNARLFLHLAPGCLLNRLALLQFAAETIPPAFAETTLLQTQKHLWFLMHNPEGHYLLLHTFYILTFLGM